MTDSDYYLDMDQFGPGLSLSKSCENSYLDYLLGVNVSPPTGAIGAKSGAPNSNLFTPIERGAPSPSHFTPIGSFESDFVDEYVADADADPKGDSLAQIFSGVAPSPFAPPMVRANLPPRRPKKRSRVSQGGPQRKRSPGKCGKSKPRPGKRSAHTSCPPRSALTAHPGLMTALRSRPRNAAGGPTFESTEARNALMEKWEWWVEKRANGLTKIQYYFHFPLAPGAMPGAKRARPIDSWAKVLRYLDV